MGDFDYGILEQTAHRPWPMPDSPWIMTQTWHELLFAHWPVDARLLRSKIPAGFELELFDGQAWLGVVPFRMSNVAPRGVPALPWISAFPELNVRTYVRVQDRPGVYFFSLDATNPVAVGVARLLVHLPYYTASITVEEHEGRIQYTSRRRTGSLPSSIGDPSPATFVGDYRATGASHRPAPGTLTYFLTERYCLYTVDSAFRAYRLDIHHPPWSLQDAEAVISENTMAEASGLRLPSMAPLLHFSRRQDAVAWPLVAIDLS